MSIECKKCGLELTDKEIGQHQEHCKECLAVKEYASKCATLIQDNIRKCVEG